MLSLTLEQCVMLSITLVLVAASTHVFLRWRAARQRIHAKKMQQARPNLARSVHSPPLTAGTTAARQSTTRELDRPTPPAWELPKWARCLFPTAGRAHALDELDDVGYTAPLSPGRPRPCPVSDFSGRWTLEEDHGHDEYLEAMKLPWVMRKAAQAVRPPDISFYLDKAGVVNSQMGPVMGRYLHESYKEGGTATESMMGRTSSVSYHWEGSTLTSQITTAGTRDLIQQRRWVERRPDGTLRMTVQAKFYKEPGDEPAVYTRHYKPVQGYVLSE